MLADELAGRARVVEVNVGEQKVPHVRHLESVPGETGAEMLERRGGAAVEQRRPLGGVEQIDADLLLEAEEMEVDRVQLIHNAIFAMSLLGSLRAVRCDGARPARGNDGQRLRRLLP